MRANEIEQKMMGLLLKSKVFKNKRRRWKGYLGYSEMLALLNTIVLDRSVDSPDMRKIRELLVQLGECPDAKLAWSKFTQDQRHVILHLNGE